MGCSASVPVKDNMEDPESGGKTAKPKPEARKSIIGQIFSDITGGNKPTANTTQPAPQPLKHNRNPVQVHHKAPKDKEDTFWRHVPVPSEVQEEKEKAQAKMDALKPSDVDNAGLDPTADDGVSTQLDGDGHLSLHSESRQMSQSEHEEREAEEARLRAEEERLRLKKEREEKEDQEEMARREEGKQVLDKMLSLVVHKPPETGGLLTLGHLARRAEGEIPLIRAAPDNMRDHADTDAKVVELEKSVAEIRVHREREKERMEEAMLQLRQRLEEVVLARESAIGGEHPDLQAFREMLASSEADHEARKQLEDQYWKVENKRLELVEKVRAKKMERRLEESNVVTAKAQLRLSCHHIALLKERQEALDGMRHAFFVEDLRRMMILQEEQHQQSGEPVNWHEGWPAIVDLLRTVCTKLSEVLGKGTSTYICRKVPNKKDSESDDTDLEIEYFVTCGLEDDQHIKGCKIPPGKGKIRAEVFENLELFAANINEQATAEMQGVHFVPRVKKSRVLPKLAKEAASKETNESEARAIAKLTEEIQKPMEGSFVAAPCIVQGECITALCVDTFHRDRLRKEITPNQQKLILDAAEVVVRVLKVVQKRGGDLSSDEILTSAERLARSTEHRRQLDMLRRKDSTPIEDHTMQDLEEEIHHLVRRSRGLEKLSQKSSIVSNYHELESWKNPTGQVVELWLVVLILLDYTPPAGKFKVKRRFTGGTVEGWVGLLKAIQTVAPHNRLMIWDAIQSSVFQTPNGSDPNVVEEQERCEVKVSRWFV